MKKEKKILPMSLILGFCVGLLSFEVRASSEGSSDEDENVAAQIFQSILEENIHTDVDRETEHTYKEVLLQEFSSSQLLALMGWKEKHPHLRSFRYHSYEELHHTLQFVDQIMSAWTEETNPIRQLYQEVKNAPENWEEYYRDFVQDYGSDNLRYAYLMAANPEPIFKDTHPFLGGVLRFLKGMEEHVQASYALVKKIESGRFGTFNHEDNVRFHPTQMEQLVNLETLYCASAKLVVLFPRLESLENLTNLNLDFSAITILPPSIGELSKLKTLIVSSENLLSLPDEIGNLTLLEKFIINEAPLVKEIPSTFWQLSNLKYLTIENSLINKVSSEIGNLQNLETLSLGHNKLEALPSEIANLTNLTHLYISDNPLKELPESWGNLGQLKKLYINNTHVERLPSTFTKENLQSLQTLQIYSPDFVQGLEELQALLPDTDISGVSSRQ